jgi:hypothetical protein
MFEKVSKFAVSGTYINNKYRRKCLLKRTISIMVGKGSQNHNCRKFHAENTDPERSYRNIEYCNEDIRAVYHELFDEAVERYNAKQKRKDRCIDDYYEKIRSSKQEKLFHEIIVQIGNKDDCGATSADGIRAAGILNEYMQDFQKRNPTLRVFSAHLHMDEATPHLHIDFVPYITGSKRGVDTRVSMKQALAALGFKGGTRSETEWSQWVNAEKEQLAIVMGRHDIEWEKKGTHEEHLSVLEYKKQERAKEVTALEEQCFNLEQENSRFSELNENLHQQICDADEELRSVQESRDTAVAELADAEKKKATAQKKLSTLTSNMQKIEQFAAEYTHAPEEWLPEPNNWELAKNYRKRIMPILREVVEILRPLYAQYLKLKETGERLVRRNADLERYVDRLQDLLSQSESENEMLRDREYDLERVRKILGPQMVDDAIATAKQKEWELAQQKTKSKRHTRDAR